MRPCRKCASIILLSAIVSSVSSGITRTHARTHARATLYCSNANVEASENGAEWRAKKGATGRREDAVAEGCQRKRKGEKKTPLSYRERTRSSTAWHQDIRDFDRAARSTTAQSLFVSYPLLLLLLGSDMHLPPPPSLCFHRSNLHISPRPSLFSSCSPGPIGRAPSPPYSLSIFFEKRLRLLPFAPPLSRPDLGASRLHVACPNDVSERTGTTAI